MVFLFLGLSSLSLSATYACYEVDGYQLLRTGGFQTHPNLLRDVGNRDQLPNFSSKTFCAEYCVRAGCCSAGEPTKMTFNGMTAAGISSVLRAAFSMVLIGRPPH